MQQVPPALGELRTPPLVLTGTSVTILNLCPGSGPSDLYGTVIFLLGNGHIICIIMGN